MMGVSTETIPRRIQAPAVSSDLTLLSEIRIAMETGEFVCRRGRARLSASEVARAIGVTPPCISRWEAVERAPKGEAAVRAARLLAEWRSRQGPIPWESTNGATP